ncbi:unnamed protein product [Oncorhynchus mykiss]|uniref:G-protein coupled receptors family 1 profile domain-containing protein n=1 Tax=Oncorhynchus mykiss TaxID=8022 RepID=A0A060WSS4_ONCMY|nr:unnamed protein product [Oncorhynchus mykiss]
MFWIIVLLESPHTAKSQPSGRGNQIMFYFVSFLLMVVYAWESKHAVEGWRERPREEESQCRQRMGVVPVYACVWFIPLVMYFVYVMTLVLVPPSHMTANHGEASTYCNSCILFLHIWRDNCSDIEHIHDIFIQCFLFVSVIPVLVCCTVVYYKVGSWYRRYEEEGLFPVEGDARSRKRLRGMFSTARYMMVVIIFCWTPGDDVVSAGLSEQCGLCLETTELQRRCARREDAPSQPRRPSALL